MKIRQFSRRIAYGFSFEETMLDEDNFIFQKSGLKPPTSVGKDPTVRRRRSKPLNPSTLVGGGSVGSLYLLKQ